jgi:hypothetical protein
MTALLIAPSLAFAQRDRDVTQLNRGMAIAVRTNQPIDSRRSDSRIYTAVVDRDVWGNNHRLAIPRGATAELIVRRGRNNALILDLESINVRGRRYGIDTDPTRVRGTSGSEDIVGSMVGTIRGVRQDEIRIPRGSEITFRLDRPLVVGVQDRGRDRDGAHYHDYYGRDGAARH